MSKLSQPKLTLEEARPFAGMSQVHPNAAGVDIGAHEIMVCVAGSETTQIVRAFGSYTVDLQAIGRWLAEHDVETVAMESTGVYWIPLFEELERQSFHCHLISSRSLRRVPGRKSDVVDCQWIQTLHSYGLLESSHFDRKRIWLPSSREITRQTFGSSSIGWLRTPTYSVPHASSGGSCSSR